MKIPLAFLMLVVSCASVRAEVEVRGLQWRWSENAKGEKNRFEVIETWRRPPAEKWRGRLRAVAVVVNRGPKRTEGVLVRYAVSMRLAPRTAPLEDGVWTIPVHIEERRIGFLKPNETKEINIDNMLLATYLKKMFRAGFWPKEIRLEAMVEPRPGQSLAAAQSTVLPVNWEARP